MKHIFLIVIGLSLSLMADFTRDDVTGVVTDNTTILQWKDDVTLSQNWTEAIAYCEGLTFATYSDWRLPNINELYSLVDKSKSDPSLDNTFHSVVSYYYWSSTTVVGGEDNAWAINFNFGGSSWGSKSLSYKVRCVRDGQ